ncbi:metallophosphoesterase [Ktedonobacteria bacterium brp13]|nr:metallophosphoesterase [Ktedonobacteria bacterium brp13]
MRLALISDIHGNTIALDAVLADIREQGGVDGYWLLGDFSAMGYDPVGVVEKIASLPNAQFVQGNHDRYLLTGECPGPTIEQAQKHPELVPSLWMMATCLAWMQGQIRAGGWLDWYQQLPLELRLTLPDGTRLLGIHVAPSLNDGPGIIPLLSDDELRSMVATADADLIVVGHTHVPLDRTVDQIRVFNLGSVSNPMRSRLEATYALLEADETGHTVQLRYVPYDYEAVITQLHAVKHPATVFLSRFMHGEVVPPWAKQ